MTTILVWALVVMSGMPTPPSISIYSDKDSCEAVRVVLVELGRDARLHKCVPIKVPSNRIT